MIAGGRQSGVWDLERDKTFAKAVLRQHDAKDALRQQEQLAQLYKLKAKKTELNFSRDLQSMVTDMSSKVGLFYLISFISFTRSHVIALSSGELKELVIFDPNLGEFQVPAKNVCSFLTKLLKQGYSVEPKNVNGLSRWDFS